MTVPHKMHWSKRLVLPLVVVTWDQAVSSTDIVSRYHCEGGGRCGHIRKSQVSVDGQFAVLIRCITFLSLTDVSVSEQAGYLTVKDDSIQLGEWIPRWSTADAACPADRRQLAIGHECGPCHRPQVIPVRSKWAPEWLKPGSHYLRS